MLGAGKHDVNNVNNVQCLIIVSIGKVLSPGEETQAVASIPTARDARHSTHARPTQQIQHQRTTPVQNTNLTMS